MKSVVTRTPLRISLFGGGTDLESFWSQQAGHVLSIAISKYIYVQVEEVTDNKYHIIYVGNEEIVDTVDEIQHEIVRECIKLTQLEDKVKISIKSDVTSSGSGLGASSTLTVGILNALYTYKGKYVDVELLASQACRLEIEILKHQIGKQDQYIAAYGGMKHIIFHTSGETEVIPIEDKVQMDKLQDRLLLFYTGISRKAEEILKEQNVLDYAKRKNLQQMADQVIKAEEYINSGNIDGIGMLMREGWELKKKLSSKITKPRIDEIINKLFQAGAMAVKVTGAGGGGCILVFHKEGYADKIRQAVSDLEEYSFVFHDKGTEVIENHDFI